MISTLRDVVSTMIKISYSFAQLVFPMKFFTFYAIMTKINLQRLYWIAYQNGIFYLIFTVFFCFPVDNPSLISINIKPEKKQKFQFRSYQISIVFGVKTTTVVSSANCEFFYTGTRRLDPFFSG